VEELWFLREAADISVLAPGSQSGVGAPAVVNAKLASRGFQLLSLSASLCKEDFNIHVRIMSYF
jgi:hypothetical protein